MKTAAPTGAAEWAGLHQAERTWGEYRLCLVVLCFYLLDAVLLGLFSYFGVGHWVSAACFAVVGAVVAGGGALLVRRNGARSLSDPRLVTAQAGSALLLTLTVGLFDPDLLAMMLLTVAVIIPTAALSLNPRALSVLCALVAAATLGVVAFHGGRLQLPVEGAAQMVLSGIFLLYTLAKGASVNAAGMTLRLELDESHARLAVALARVQQLAEHDELTGLPNRRRVLAALDEERERRSRQGVGFAVAMLDIDHFKRINDRHGHPIGDEVLRSVATLLRGVLRKPDLVGRVGGEEFLVILPGADGLDPARQAAERMRLAIEGSDWSHTADDLRVTASIGVAVCRPGEEADSLVARADRALYRAKHGGRNRIASDTPQH